jgi:hypothetical protein
MQVKGRGKAADLQKALDPRYRPLDPRYEKRWIRATGRWIRDAKAADPQKRSIRATGPLDPRNTL